MGGRLSRCESRGSRLGSFDLVRVRFHYTHPQPDNCEKSEQASGVVGIVIIGLQLFLYTPHHHHSASLDENSGSHAVGHLCRNTPLISS